MFVLQQNVPENPRQPGPDTTKMPLYPHSILKRPTDFPPVPFNLDEDDRELLDNASLDVILPNRDNLDDFADFESPTSKPGMYKIIAKSSNQTVTLKNNFYRFFC